MVKIEISKKGEYKLIVEETERATDIKIIGKASNIKEALENLKSSLNN